MRRALAATFLGLLVLSGPGGTASAAQRCDFKRSHTVASNDQARLFWVKGRGAEQRVYFGCLRKRRPILLGADRVGGPTRTLNGTFRLSGTWIAWRQTHDDAAHLIVRSVAPGGRKVRQDISRYELRSLALAPDGSVAWILGIDEFREVGGVAATTTVPTTLAFALGIDSESLTLAGSRVGYRSAGVARSGRLTVPSPAPGGTAVGPQGLDGRFGDCGSLVPRSPKAGEFTEATQLARTFDGALVAAGTTASQPTADDAVQDTFVISRFSASGRFDADFGRNGVVQVRVPRPAGAGEASLTGLTVQPDGRIVVAGHVALATAGGYRALAMRFDADGKLDPAFGNGGVVRDAIKATATSRIEDLASAPSGALLATGQRDGRYFVAQLTADGALDPAFGTSGIVADPGKSASRLAALAVQPDGTIFAAGGSGTPLLLRLASDGTVLSASSAGPPAMTSLVAVEPTAEGGAIAVGTGANVRVADQLVLARYDAEGKPAGGFDRDGFVLDHQVSAPRDIAVAPDGSLLVSARFSLTPGDYTGDGLVRYTAAGARDTTFGLRGVLGGTSSFGLAHHDVLAGADGTAIVAQDNAGSFAISRYAVSAPAITATRSRSTVCAMATALAIEPLVRTRRLDVSLRLRAPGKVRLDAVIEVGGRRIPAGTITVFRPYVEGAVATIPLTRKAAAALAKADTAKLTISAGAPGKATKAYEATLTR